MSGGACGAALESRGAEAPQPHQSYEQPRAGQSRSRFRSASSSSSRAKCFSAPLKMVCMTWAHQAAAPGESEQFILPPAPHPSQSAQIILFARSKKVFHHHLRERDVSLWRFSPVRNWRNCCLTEIIFRPRQKVAAVIFGKLDVFLSRFAET